jgi:hypothetical protein
MSAAISDFTPPHPDDGDATMTLGVPGRVAWFDHHSALRLTLGAPFIRTGSEVRRHHDAIENWRAESLPGLAIAAFLSRNAQIEPQLAKPPIV